MEEEEEEEEDNNKKKLDNLTVKIRLALGNSAFIISRKQSHLLPCYPFPCYLVLGVERVEEEPQSSKCQTLIINLKKN